MTMQYILSGGQLKFDQVSFTRELLLPTSPLKNLLHNQNSSFDRKPVIVKTENLVTIYYNDASDIVLDEGFYDLFKKLKVKYKEKLKGRVVIRITALSSYHVILNLDSEDDKVVYE